MIKSLALGACALTLCGSLSAQTKYTYEELPKGFTAVADKNYDYFLLPRTSYHPLHVQYNYDLADLALPVSNIAELSWRRNNYYGNSGPAGSVTMTVTMGLSPNLPSAMSTTFANNITVLPKQVFKGTINYPVATKGTGPAPWTHVLPLATKYLVVKAATNKSMTVDMVITATTGYTTSTYTMDAAAPDTGGRLSNGSAPSTCKFSNAKYASGLSYSTTNMKSPGSWYVNYNSILPNAPGIMTISAFGIDNKGTWPLPISLAGLGAPGCNWHIGLESAIWIPVTASATGSARVPTLPIPTGLSGKYFYDHSLWLDQKANKAGLVVGWSSKWYIGTGKAPSANTLYKTADTAASPTGSMRRNYGTHMRISR